MTVQIVMHVFSSHIQALIITHHLYYSSSWEAQSETRPLRAQYKHRTKSY